MSPSDPPAVGWPRWSTVEGSPAYLKGLFEQQGETQATQRQLRHSVGMGG